MRRFSINVFIEGSKIFKLNFITTRHYKNSKTFRLIELIPICTVKEFAELKCLAAFLGRNTYPTTIDETPMFLQKMFFSMLQYMEVKKISRKKIYLIDVEKPKSCLLNSYSFFHT